MLDQDQFSKLKTLITNNQEIYLILRPNPRIDYLASATSLYLALQSTKKRVLLLSPEKIESNKQQLSAIDLIENKIANKNLTIQLDYDENVIDKISYNIGEKEKKFYLNITPKKGFKPLDYKKVEYYYSGVAADLIICFGIKEFQELGQLYKGFEDLYENTPIITFNSFISELGSLNFSSTNNVCLTELMTELLLQLDLISSAEIATNLLRGIEEESQQFSHNMMNADSFELIAKLLRLGATRFNLTNFLLKQQNIKTNSKDKAAIQPSNNFSQKDTQRTTSSPKTEIGSLHYQPSQFRR